MKARAALILKPFAIGIMGLFFTFMIMTASSPTITTLFSAVLYFSLGLWLGKIQPQTLWYAPLLTGIPIWAIFIPMGMEFWPPVVRIWSFLMPPFAALPATYLGMYAPSTSLFSKSTSRQASRIVGVGTASSSFKLKSLGNYILVFVLGFGCMFICLFLLLLFTFYWGLSFGLSYALSYLLVYPFLAVVLALRYREPSSIVALVLCLSPTLYWFFLLWSDGKLHINGMSFSDSTIMMIVMPLTLALSCLAAFATYKLKKS